MSSTFLNDVISETVSPEYVHNIVEISLCSGNGTSEEIMFPENADTLEITHLKNDSGAIIPLENVHNDVTSESFENVISEIYISSADICDSASSENVGISEIYISSADVCDSASSENVDTHEVHKSEIVSKNSISCRYCICTFSARKNLYRHVRKFHPTESIQYSDNVVSLSTQKSGKISVSCKYCDATFSEKKFLFRHVKELHCTGSSEFYYNTRTVSKISVSSKISCSFCNRTFRARKNLYRHIRQQHPSESIEFPCNTAVRRTGNSSMVPVLCCQYCIHDYTARKNVCSHARNFLPSEILKSSHNVGSVSHEKESLRVASASHDSVVCSVKDKRNSQISCKYCNHIFSAKKNLYRHVRRCHPSETIKFSHSVAVCSICEVVFRSLEDLQSHIGMQHSDISLSFEEKEFNSLEDFKLWKAKVESETKSRFVKHSSDSNLANGATASYYYCHRSGSHKPKENRKHPMRRETKKIGKTCPANMKVYKQILDGNTEIKVVYQSVHVGHQVGNDKIVQRKKKRPQTSQLNETPPQEVHESVTPVVNYTSLTQMHDYQECNTGLTQMHDYQECNTGQEIFFLPDDSIPVGIGSKNLQNEHCNQVTEEMQKSGSAYDIEQEKAAVIMEIQSLLPLIAGSKSIEHLKLLHQDIRVTKTKWIAAWNMCHLFK